MLSSPPVNLEGSWSLKIFNKKFYVKNLCLRACFEQNFLFFVFLFKYDVLIIKKHPIALLAKKIL